MKKISLSEWASIAEVIGAGLLVISLLFVAYSINRNSAMMEAQAESDFLDSWRTAIQIPFYTDERLAEIQLKVHSGQELDPVEGKMWENFQRAFLDTWWQYFGAHEKGLVSDQAWEEMDAAISTLWERERLSEFWDEMGVHYAGTKFGDHINELAKTQTGGSLD